MVYISRLSVVFGINNYALVKHLVAFDNCVSCRVKFKINTLDSVFAVNVLTQSLLSRLFYDYPSKGNTKIHC